MKFAFILMGSGFDSEKDRAAIHGGEIQVAGVPDLSEGCRVAKELCGLRTGRREGRDPGYRRENSGRIRDAPSGTGRNLCRGLWRKQVNAVIRDPERAGRFLPGKNLRPIVPAGRRAFIITQSNGCITGI